MFEKMTTDAIILHFDDEFYILLFKKVLFIAIDIINIMLDKQMASRLLATARETHTFLIILK